MKADIERIEHFIKGIGECGLEDCSCYKELEIKNIEILIKVYRDLEKKYNKLFDEYNDRVEEIINLENNSIPKSKIKEKIEECKNAGVTRTLNNENEVIEEYYFLQDEIDILQEILDETKKD